MKVTDPVPLSEVVRRAITTMIDDGLYEQGARLPSEQELAKELGVSRVTLRETLKELEEDGIVYRQHGLGTFVAQELPVVECAIQLNLGVSEMIARSGLECSTSFIEVNDDFRDGDIGKIFGDPKARLVAVRRVRNAEERPVVASLDVLPWSPDIDFEATEVMSRSIYQFLEEEVGLQVKEGKAILEPSRANQNVARSLQISPGSSILRLEQVDYSPDMTPILFSQEFWAKQVIKFVVTRIRPSH